MQPLRMPFVTLLSLGGLWCMFLGPDTQYRQRMSLEDLIERQSHIFPIIAPFVKFNPSTQPPRPPGAPVPVELPLFAEALGPEEWLAYNARCWSVKSGLQLSKDSRLLKDAQKVLRNKDLAGATLSQANRHAFETTAMIRALQFAREEGGVLAPAQFVWLRAHDRTLWYPMNNLGRQSFHMEALGAMSHFKAEKLTQRPIPVPKVGHAIETIQEYMKSVKARPIPNLDYSQSKKRGVKKAV